MMVKKHIAIFETFAFSIVTYLALIIKWGYEFGRSDHIEVIPYAKILQGSQSFKEDFFYQSLINIVPNERWVIASFLSLFGHLELVCLLLHIATTLLLIIAMEQVGKLLLKNVLLVRISIFLCLVLLYYDYNLGGNDLYYNVLQASNIAKMFGMWALFFALKSQWSKTTLLIALSTFIHPIAGLTLAITLYFSLFILLIQRKVDRKKVILNFLSYLLTGGTFIFLTHVAYWKAGNGIHGDANSFNIIFRFRNGHHYMPDMFHIKGWLLMLCCYVLTWWKFHKNEVIKGWLIAFSLGIIIYLLGLYFKSWSITSLQWFKLTIWLKYFGILAFFTAINPYLSSFYTIIANRTQPFLYILLISCSILFLLYAPKEWFPDGVHYDFGKQKLEDPAVCISLLAKEYTPENAVFLVPYNFAELSCYGERACYISDKANPKYPEAAIEWAKRVSIFYGLNSESDAMNWNKANQRYNLILPGKRKYMQDHGITHFISLGKIKGYNYMANCGNYYLYRVGE